MVKNCEYHENFTLNVLLYTHENDMIINVTGPAKRDQVGTRYIISQNRTYLEFWVYYSLSVNCKMLLMQLVIDGENFTYIASADH